MLTITNWYPPHHFGGYELSCFDVMTRLEERGHEVHVLCGDTRTGSEAGGAQDGDHETRVRRSLRLYHDGEQILRPSWRERWQIERHNQRELRQALAEISPDVVSIWHLAGASHGLLSPIVRSGIPVVFAVCDDWLTYGVLLDAWAAPFHGSRLRNAAGRVVGKLAGVPCVVPDISGLGSFLFVTRAMEEKALSKSRWHPQRRAVVWSGIDTDIFQTREEVERPWGWRLIAAGRFDPRKGFETPIRALTMLPEEATLALWGRGGEAERARLEKLVRELGVEHRVSFGTLDREDLPAQYRASDAMVFPSVWAEPFGLVPIEAMACGVPVVATGVGGSAEFLADGFNCLLSTPGDAAGLAERVRRLADDPTLRAQLVEGGHRTAVEMDVERLADVMEQWHVYEAGGRSGDPPAQRSLARP